VAGPYLDVEVGAAFYGRTGPCVTGDMSGCAGLVLPSRHPPHSTRHHIWM